MNLVERRTYKTVCSINDISDEDFFLEIKKLRKYNIVITIIFKNDEQRIIDLKLSDEFKKEDIPKDEFKNSVIKKLLVKI